MRIAPTTRLLVLFALVNVAVIPLGLRLLAGTSWRETELAHTASVLRLRPPGDDSWHPMAEAVGLAGGGPPLYQALFFDRKIKFQYPPTSLLALYPLVRGPAADWLRQHGLPWILLLHGLSWLLLAATAYWVVRIYQVSLKEGPLGRQEPPGADKVLVAGIGLGLTLTFYPVLMAHALGQIQVWINALFALLFLCWLGGRERTAGVAAGVMCLIKPQYGVLLLWGVLRRRWGFVLAAAATGAVGVVVSLALFGLADHLDYLKVLTFISRHGEAYYPNQSVNGLLNRLLGNGSNLEWQPHAFAPFHPVVYLGTLATSLLLLAVAFFWPVSKDERGSTADLALVALAGTLASPVAWEHHYGVLLPIYAFLYTRLASQHVLGRWTLPTLAVSYVLTSHYFACTNRLAGTAFNPVQSYVLAGGLLALVLLHRLRDGSGVAADVRPVAGRTGYALPPVKAAG